MQVDPRLFIGIGIALAVWLFVRWRSPRPDFPPLETSPDDPLLVAALEKARASVGEFMALARGPKQNALVKLRFVSNSDQIEHLWAEVVSIVDDHGLEVRLVTPPITHSGHLDRLYRCRLDEIEDWQVLDSHGKIHGGFTQRAMFAIARRDGIKLPRKLLDAEKAYEEG